ncbi:unnamed protein product [Gadus morhua 'NCC']
MAPGVQMRVASGHLEILQVYQLLQCVRHGDKNKIKKLLRLGVPNLLNLSEPSEGQAALHLACIAPDPEMVEFLLSQGALPIVQDLKGRTPAMMAAELGQDSTMVLLAKSQADMELVDHQGKGVLFYCLHPTALHQCCLQVALINGADPNNSSAAGVPVLVLACQRAPEFSSMGLSLLDQGADPNAVSQVTGLTALMEACRVGAVDLARDILQRGADPNALDQRRRTAAHLAAQGGFFEVLVLLSAYGADLGCADRDLSNPLHKAAAEGFADCCRFLAQRGCNTKQKNVDGLLPRQLATDKATSKELKKAESLQGKLSKPGAEDPNPSWKLTLHDWSCENQDALRTAMETMEDAEACLETVAMGTFSTVLKDHKAPLEEDQLLQIIQAHQQGGDQAMDLGEFFKGLGYLQKAFTLGSYDPKPEKKKKKAGKGPGRGKSVPPMPICVLPELLIRRRPDVRHPEFMIEQRQPAIDSGFFVPGRRPRNAIEDDRAWYIDQPDQVFIHINHCVKTSDLESLSLAFSQGVPVDVQDRYYKTPLMTACSIINLEVARFLISMGADVNSRDQLGWTPLHHACHTGRLDMVELLVSAGAKVDAAALHGGTPLMTAIDSRALCCVEYLINAGADVMAETKHGEDCLTLARSYDDDELSELVQSKVDRKHQHKEQKGNSGGTSKKTPQDPPQQVQKPLKRGEDVLHLHHNISSGNGLKRDISFVPRLPLPPIPQPLSPQVRGCQATTAQLIDRSEERAPRTSVGF